MKPLQSSSKQNMFPACLMVPFLLLMLALLLLPLVHLLVALLQDLQDCSAASERM
jgi:ABC-type sugar transport system permease subunit